MTRPVETVDALVVGGGPAGLAAATALRAGGAGRVLVVEREDQAGGTPRLCAHTGFGLRDLHRVLSGPAYARRWVARAGAAGVEIRTASMVTGWAGPKLAEVTAEGGLFQVAARVVVLATGARERPRSARLVPGSRPAGIFTTGQLQQWVHGQGLPLQGRALVVGAEHVSYSAVLTLREAGARPLALVTDLPRTQTFAAFDLAIRAGLRVPVWTGTTVAGITGRDRVESVLLRGPGGARSVDVDAVVFTGDFIPDNELSRLAALAIDPGTRGPACDPGGATTAPGVYAAGNVVHPAETGDVAAGRGRVVGASAAAWLRREGTGDADDGGDPRATVRMQAAAPLRWVVPNLVHPGTGSSGGHVLVRTEQFLDRPVLTVTQDGRVLGSSRPRRLVPNRSYRMRADWLSRVQPGGDVVVSVS